MPNGNIISGIGSKADILSDNIISNDSENVNKKFSMKDSVEDNGELIAVHNIYRVTPKISQYKYRKKRLVSVEFAIQAVICCSVFYLAQKQ